MAQIVQLFEGMRRDRGSEYSARRSCKDEGILQATPRSDTIGTLSRPLEC